VVNIGIVESLYEETKSFGIRTLLLEPGRFRTKLLSPTNMKTSEAEIADYFDFSTGLRKGLANENSKQPGDPKKFVQLAIDLVCKEGVFKDKDVGIRLPLGNDAYDEIAQKLAKTTALLKDWEAVIRSTDHTP
jgi:NAD(P)-dependent dehydrogenase (short-subunit alcohol dehydrogenase family)